ncbi:MAG: hypothetical protein JXJ17_18490 [Anaerolineae bacterium]|nr:hypothetical protein [Anaerolineae bacterium]
MLYPISNYYRQVTDLSGMWEIRFDPDDEGREAGWAAGFEGGQPIAVPASWNEQFAAAHDYTGAAWVQLQFDRPWGWADQRCYLRFDAVSYRAEVWLNGVAMGEHVGGYLPFEFDVMHYLAPVDNMLVVRVEGSPDGGGACGIQRPTMIYTRPHGSIRSLAVQTGIDGPTGLVRAVMERTAGEPVTARFVLRGFDIELVEQARSDEQLTEVNFSVPDAELWAPGAPNRYQLDVDLLGDEGIFDQYTLPVGIRSAAVDGDQLLLNGEPVVLRGFGYRDDFPVTGEGVTPAAIIRDFEWMQRLGANALRTAGHPCSEEAIRLADRLGLMVVVEAPALPDSGNPGAERRREESAQVVCQMIERDKNHPSVIAWCVANDPVDRAGTKALVDMAKELDPARPVAIASRRAAADSFEFCDIACLTVDAGQGGADLPAAVGAVGRPVMIDAAGAEAVAGLHADPPEPLSEEQQADLLLDAIEVMESIPAVVGQFIGMLCDTRGDRSGALTRDRRPKLAAWRVGERWRDKG